MNERTAKQCPQSQPVLSSLEFTQGVHCCFQDVKVLYKQLAGSELEQTDVPMGTGLDDVLETIRVQWERDVEKNRAEAGALLQAKVRDQPGVPWVLGRRKPSKMESSSG